MIIFSLDPLMDLKTVYGPSACELNVHISPIVILHSYNNGLD